MTPEDIEEFAIKNKLDVREMNPSFYRLINDRGRFIMDIYIKHKKGKIIKNSTLLWKNRRWYFPKNTNDLKVILINN